MYSAVKSKSSLFEQYKNDLLEQIREAYWNEPAYNGQAIFYPLSTIAPHTGHTQ